jgi:hypothetical protein
MWEVGLGRRIRIEDDLWVGCGENYKLSRHFFETLRERGFFKLSQVVDSKNSTPWKQEWLNVDKMGLNREVDISIFGYIERKSC